MLSWAINGWIWAGLIVVYYIIDGINTKYIKSVQGLNSLVAANTSSAQWLFGILGTYLCVKDNILDVIPIMIGAWLGTYYTVEWIKNEKKIIIQAREWLSRRCHSRRFKRSSSSS